MNNRLLEELIPMMASHRGVKNENTIEGVLEAINRGIKIIEVDVASTSDNILVLYHDWYVRSFGRINSINYADLRSIIPEITTLNELLIEIKERNVVINLDCAEPKRLNMKQLLLVLKTIRKYGLENKVYIEVPKKRFITCLFYNRHFAYELVFDKLNWKFFVFKPLFNYVDYMIILNRIPNANNIKKVHEMGHIISYWTADSPLEASELIEMGYDVVGVNNI